MNIEQTPWQPTVEEFIFLFTPELTPGQGEKEITGSLAKSDEGLHQAVSTGQMNSFGTLDSVCVYGKGIDRQLSFIPEELSRQNTLYAG